MEREQLEGKIPRVLVVDNSLIHTQLLAHALRQGPALEVFTSYSDARSVIEAGLAPNLDVLVISSNLDEKVNHGCEVLRELHTLRPGLRSVVLLDSSKKEVILEAFRAGAQGVFSRVGSVETLCKCVHCVYQGQIWADSRQLETVLKAFASSPTVRALDARGMTLLSKREMDVVQSLAEGLTNREIAKRFGLSQHTVKNYLFRIFDKLGASNRMELLFMTLHHNNNSQTAANSELPDSLDSGLEDDPLVC